MYTIVFLRPFLVHSLRRAVQGTILIAVNPLQRVPDPEMSEYMDKSLNPEGPHPYAIAEVGHDSCHTPCIYSSFSIRAYGIYAERVMLL